ncbi:MAG: YadA-like family protein, partial [Pseudoxanthomonas sp.]
SMGAYSHAGDGSVAMGHSAYAEGMGTIAVGQSAYASGVSSTALGGVSDITYGAAAATGAHGTALGSGSRAGSYWDSTLVGDYTTAVGSESWAIGMYGTTLGYNSFGNADQATSLGANAWVQDTATNSVALGYGSLADRPNTVSVGAAADWSPSLDGSISNIAAFDRQITNVAAGTELTDAVNVSQLTALADAVEASEIHYFSVNDDGVAGGNFDNLGATGINAIAVGVDSVASADGAYAAGYGALAIGLNSIAVGTAASATGDNAIAQGNGATVEGADSIALGNGASVTGDNGLALGAGATVTHANSVALGAGSATTVGAQSGYDAAYVGSSDSAGEVNIGGRTITGVAPGIAGTDAVNVDQLNAGVQAANDYTDTQIGAVNTAITELGDRVTTVEGDITALDGRVTTVEGDITELDGRVTNVEGAVANAVQYDDETHSSITLGGSEGTTISNVAAGTADTDAANVGQVNAGDAETLAAANDYTDQTATETLTAANDYTDAKFAAWDDNLVDFKNEVNRSLDKLDRRIDRQGAMSAAMLNMSTSVAGIRTQNRMGVGVGFQGGETAVSLGYQRAISDRATVTIGGAFSSDDTSVGVGAGFGW